MVMSALLQVLQVFTVLLCAPLLRGVINQLKALVQSKRGPSIWQPYRDLWKLLHKGSVVSEYATWIYYVTPYFTFITPLASRFSLKLPEGWERHRTSSGPLTAQEVMRSRLFAVTPSTSIVEAFHLMLAQHIKRLVVVDEQGKSPGLVDRHHLLRSLLKNGSFPH